LCSSRGTSQGHWLGYILRIRDHLLAAQVQKREVLFVSMLLFFHTNKNNKNNSNKTKIYWQRLPSTQFPNVITANRARALDLFPRRKLTIAKSKRKFKAGFTILATDLTRIKKWSLQGLNL
jgi:hypothetical protein